MTERLYYSDSTLTRFHSRVADIRLVSRPLSAASGKALWQVALEASAFYPSGGGQPFDTGILRATSRSGALLEVPVMATEEDEQGEVWHFVEKPLSAGTEVEGVVDRHRRRDHMQQHSGQHLLSAVFATELNLLTVSFHLGEQSNTIDLKTDDLKINDLESHQLPTGSANRAPSSEWSRQLEHVERIANEIIAEDRAVSIRTVDADESRSLLASGRLRKLPEREGAIRLVEIRDYDLNACGGTHVQSTGQIGGLFLRSTEKVRNGLRVEFVCGLRAVVAARQDHELLAYASAAMSLSSTTLPEALQRMLAAGKTAAKELRKLREQIADMRSDELVRQLPSGSGLKVLRRVFDQGTDIAIDADQYKRMASRIVATATDVLVLFAFNQPPSAMIIVASSTGQAFSCGDLLRTELARLGLRGGGSREMAQGQASVEQAGELLDALEAAARAVTIPVDRQSPSICTR